MKFVDYPARFARQTPGVYTRHLRVVPFSFEMSLITACVLEEASGIPKLTHSLTRSYTELITAIAPLSEEFSSWNNRSS